MPRRRNSPTKVTPYLVEAVRLASTVETQSEIAVRLGCSTATVARIQKWNGFEHFTRASGRAFSCQRARRA